VNDRFDRRLSVLDDSDQFLKAVAWLGGYITTEQAQGLGISLLVFPQQFPLALPGREPL
jgi:hypothetical protein